MAAHVIPLNVKCHLCHTIKFLGYLYEKLFLFFKIQNIKPLNISYYTNSSKKTEINEGGNYPQLSSLVFQNK